MLLTVAVVSVAPGAVPEFHIGVCEICPSAYSAAVMIRCTFLLSGLGFGEGDGDKFGRLIVPLVYQLPTEGRGENIDDISTEEKEIVGESNHTKEIHREGIEDQAVQGQRQIHNRQNPGPYRDEEE